MTSPDAMEFITITTGSTTIARRADLEQETMIIARDLIAGVPHADGWGVEITASHPTSHGWTISVLGQEICFCLLCVEAVAHDQMWEIAESLAPERTVLHRPRGTPWFAVSLAPPILGLPREMQLALPWLETALAWALMEGAAP
jgi:hypothetical protein